MKSSLQGGTQLVAFLNHIFKKSNFCFCTVKIFPALCLEKLFNHCTSVLLQRQLKSHSLKLL
uniref:Uncharacterized protein n=1 Tax=Anguilla anguilla TaxID=7936 RepID=A0A0E9XFZ6_ANGAN